MVIKAAKALLEQCCFRGAMELMVSALLPAALAGQDLKSLQLREIPD